MHTMHSMHIGKLKVGGRKYAAILVGYGFELVGKSLNGVQWVGGSNPLATTKKNINSIAYKVRNPTFSWILAFFVFGVPLKPKTLP
jgi:hypothetical protein